VPVSGIVVVIRPVAGLGRQVAGVGVVAVGLIVVAAANLGRGASLA
jgi:hypothetical protein